MAVQPQTPYKEYTANGSTKSFALEFDCDNQDHLIVLVDDVEAIVGTWSLSNGAVVFGNAPATGKKITVQRNTPFRRDGDFQSYDNSFRPGPVNKGFDWIWLKLQELGVADWILSNRINDLRAYVDKQDNVLQDNIDSLKNYVDDKDDELRNYLLNAIQEQGVALDQLEEYYSYLMQQLAQVAIDRGWAASFIVSADGSTQQEINDFGGAKWWDKPLGYGIGATVKLDNGDIVKSTVDGNKHNPNTDMTGWKKPQASDIFYDSGYSVQAALYYLTPEMFGAVGDGVTDDYQAIQTMLNVGAAGCTFEFDGSKTYYNAFVIDSPAVFVDHKNGASNSKQWTRSLGATFKFNGARLTRRAPTGDIEDIPYKTKYSDNDSTSLLIKDATKIIICDPYIDCGANIRGLINLSSAPITGTLDYYRANVGVFGLRLWRCSDIELRNVHAEKGYFNVFLDSCSDVHGTIISKYAVQCPIRSYSPNDLNFGGAVKVWFCKDVDLNIRGAYNANATAEVEKGNYNVRITGSSKNDWSNSVVIQDTQEVTIDWFAEDVKSGTGVYIKRTGEEATPNLNNIKGRIHAKNCYWRGVMIENADGTVGDLYGVQLDIVTENCGDGGLYIRNNSASSLIDGIKIDHYSKNDNGTNKARCFIGRMKGVVTGGQTGTNYGALVQGVNTASTCITLSIDASNCTVPYDVASTAFVNFKEFVTSTDVITAFAGKNMQLGTTTNKGNYVNQGEIRLNHFSVKVTAQYNVFNNLAGSSGNERLRMWYDSAAGVSVTGGTNYPLKVFIPSS